MVSRDFVFWAVDVQRDFVLPGGNLYMQDAEKLLPNIRRLADAARQGKLIKLAVFDHIFHGRPQRRPVVTLAWKDWKGADPVAVALSTGR